MESLGASLAATQESERGPHALDTVQVLVHRVLAIH
jgi:hypothetical protein